MHNGKTEHFLPVDRNGDTEENTDDNENYFMDGIALATPRTLYHCRHRSHFPIAFQIVEFCL